MYIIHTNVMTSLLRLWMEGIFSVPLARSEDAKVLTSVERCCHLGQLWVALIAAGKRPVCR